jgi:4-amino-4-deoxy-L-arabinose transferase-like glycosyltransferase
VRERKEATRKDSLSSTQYPVPSTQRALPSPENRPPGSATGTFRATAILLAVLLFSCWFLFFHRLADRDLWSSHEARAAQDAQSILSDGAWGLPRLFDRKVELQKPPLYYWLVAALAQLRGGTVDAWAVRLPAALAGLGGVLLVWFLATCRGRAVAGVLAATMLATGLHYTWLARTGRIDMPLSFAVAVALAGFYLGEKGRQQEGRARSWPWLLVGYLAVAVGVLLKGPIGAVLPLAVAGVFLLVEGRLPAPWRGRSWAILAHEGGLWWGVPLVLALTLPWYVWANAQTGGEFFRVFLWRHNVDRGFGSDGTLSAHPWWFYGPRLTFDLLPWSLLLPVLGWFLLRRGRWREDPEARLGLVWLLTVVGLLSCLRFKRADYLLPAYPGAALFLGCTAERCFASLRRPRVLLTACTVVLGGCAAGWWIYLGEAVPRRDAALEYRRFAAEVRRHAPPPSLVLFFRAEAHALAFHVGRPIDTLLEWENLDYWAGRPEMYYIIMPPECAREWARHLKSGQLQEVLRSTDLPGNGAHHPLVLLRTLPGAGPPSL